MTKANKALRSFFIFSFIAIFIAAFTIVPFDSSIFADNAIKVYIDAGHGGRDPGAVRFGLNEKDPNLDIALRLKGKLEANGFRVIMTRTSDLYYSLDERVEMANNSGADLFLSIHNNAAFSESANGTETFWCPNGVNGSSQFASLVQSNMLAEAGRANRGVKTANFRVIKYTTMPAALVECAFVSNPTENNLLKTGDFREKCAVGLYKAIKTFAATLESSSGGGFSGFSTIVDSPSNGAVLSGNFAITGWSGGPELDLVEFYKGKGRSQDNFLADEDSFRTGVHEKTGKSGYFWKEGINIDKLDEGENIIYIYSYDKDGNYSAANVKVNIIKDGQVETNLNPIADPGGPYNALVEEEITFDGSGSTDNDGEIAEYIWNFGDGQTGSGIRSVHIYTEAGSYTATLKVKDDDGALSSTVQTTVTVEESEEPPADEGLPDEEEPQDDGEDSSGQDDEEGNNGQDKGEDSGGTFEKVDNSTSVTGYIDITAEDLVRIFEEKDSGKTKKAARLAPLYIKYGKLFDIRADIAWAQMIHETGFLEYTGDVSAKQNNFAGIGATGGGVPGNSFDSEALGIIAQYAHLAWYYYPRHMNNYCSPTYDPRHFGDGHTRYTGDTSLGFLNGRWAPGSTYTNKIILFANEILEGMGSIEEEPNQAPTADAGGPYTATAGEELNLDGSASTEQLGFR